MIFEDPSQRRWKVVMAAFILLLLSGITLLFFWLSSIIIDPPLASVVKQKENAGKAMQIKQQIIAADTGRVGRGRRNRISVGLGHNWNVVTTTLSLAALTPDSKIDSAFLLQGDADGIRSLKDHGQGLDIIFPDWYFVTKPACDVSEREDVEVTKIISASSHAALFPRIANVDGGIWKGVEVGTILQNQETRQCLADTIGSLLKNSPAKGINVDFEALQPEDREPYLEFLISLTDILHKQNQLVVVDIPPNDPAFDLEYIGKIADGVVFMAYDEHYPGGMPGSIAGQDWFADALNNVSLAIPANKLMVAVGQYGYDWTIGTTTPAQSMTFSETMSLAREVDAEPEMDTSTRNMQFGYSDDNNQAHQVWFLNGVTAWNETRAIAKNNFLGTSLWRLGTEDPNFWKITERPNVSANDFATSPPLAAVRYLSQGELFHLKYPPQPGRLNLTFDNGSIDYAQYTQLPSGYELERVGKDMPPKSLILTFDDGPDPQWTPQILAILEKYKVPAAFFVVGQQADQYPELLTRMAHDGFLVGNHTYLHPDISTISSARLKLELNKTARVIESAYGKKTILFRPPFDTDTSPSTADQLRSIAAVSRYGYIFAGANIDSDDWRRLGVPAIISQVENLAADPTNHVIVMHDAGGDRSQTVQALDRLIPDLQAKGYHFIGLPEASGIKAADLNQPLEAKEWFMVKAVTIVASLNRSIWIFIRWAFIITTLLAVFRILSLGTIVVIPFLRKKKDAGVDKFPPVKFVSVLIPAYNEEKTIAATISSILASIYKEFEVVVIDDGSKDGTSAVVQSLAKQDTRVRLISQINSGKASALNRGMREAKAEVVVTIDADTIFYPFTLGELVRPMADLSVDAACGNVEVGNVHNILTGFQALEYITTQNFDRRAFDALNCIGVVPGATGAWRKAKILAIGGYLDDTLTEDADITLRLLAAGGRIVYAAAARSKTEAPETISALATQRFRWSFGTYQCLWKNRSLFFGGTLGWVALPNIFLFQVVFPLLSPIGDAVFFLSFFRGDMRAIMFGYLLFLFMDLSCTILAFVIEKRRPRLLWLVLIQRFFYRQFMYIIAYRALVAILSGKRQGWNKLKRTGRMV